MMYRWVRELTLGAALCLSVAPLAYGQRAVAADRTQPETNDVLLDRLVTVQLSKVTLEQALTAVAAAANVQLLYESESIASATIPVTLRVMQRPLREVFEQLLSGTHLQAISVGKRVISIEPRVAMTMRKAQGIITGVVLDASTKRPIAGATITLDGGAVIGRTTEDGSFHVAGISAGTHRVVVRRLGYQVYATTAEVKDNETTTLTMTLSPAATRLTEVVTTALGNQRRLEVGNVIAHLNVDSIAPTAAVTSLTDLLSARAPNVQVIPSTGLVGSGPSIRIRGQSSLMLANDPILIVDGIRQDNTRGDAYRA